jgi:hypothetical protein
VHHEDSAIVAAIPTAPLSVQGLPFLRLPERFFGVNVGQEREHTSFGVCRDYQGDLPGLLRMLICTFSVMKCVVSVMAVKESGRIFSLFWA